MRIPLLVATVIATLFYLMTGLVYAEGGFDGALVRKPYPMYPVIFGGGEEGAWARHHPGEKPPWFMQPDVVVIARFSWEEGAPAWVTAYEWGCLVTLVAWVALAVSGAVTLTRALARRWRESGTEGGSG